MLRRAGWILQASAGAGSPLVPAKTLRSELDQREREAMRREDAEAKKLPRDVLPPKKYRPMSLRAREEVMRRESSGFEHITVDDDAFGQRLDEFVLGKYPHLSYKRMQGMVEKGLIYRYRHTGKRQIATMTDRLQRGEMVVLPPAVREEAATLSHLNEGRDGIVEPQIIDDPALARSGPDGRPARKRPPLSAKLREEAFKWVVYKNKHCIVLNKPSGVPINGGPGIGINVADMLPAWKFSNPHAPLLVHRLDRDTSGILVLARNPDAQRMLGRMFVRRSTPYSVYWGVLVGKPASKFGRIRMHLEVNKQKGGTHIVARTTPTRDSRAAIAEYVVNASASDFACHVSFYPLTSQTSQLRIMAAHALGCPILGDAKFGGDEAFPPSMSSFFDPDEKGIQLHLHHRKIQLPYKNSTGEFEVVNAPVPPALATTMKKLGWSVEVDDVMLPG
uniref:Pseudouridylate synthase RPUSD4, mitochondrial n=1 Tax=Neobodo designis TaxID=312471 RepID=A0A7S1Q644_NEODS